jgi:triosephosphate isomerase
MLLKTPFILLNFKTYREATGRNAVRIAETAETISQRHSVCIAVSPAYTDIMAVARLGVPTFSQHIDAKDPGACTGFVTAESVKQAGAVGTIINHSERPLRLSQAVFCIERAKANGLVTVCCADSMGMTEILMKYRPDFISFEPPELIGSGKSVSRLYPEAVRDVIDLGESKGVKVLCGAGITTKEDVKAALELGACGVLVSSAVVKAKNKEKILEEMALGLR